MGTKQRTPISLSQFPLSVSSYSSLSLKFGSATAASPFQNKSPVTCQVVYYQSKCDVSAVRQTAREKVTLIAASFSGTIIFSRRHPSLPPSLYLSSIFPSLLHRSLTPFAVEHNLSAINFP